MPAPATGGGERTIAAHQSSTAPLQLFSSWFCPYAQRAWLALEETGVDYSWREIQPYLLDETTGEPTKNPKTLAQKRQEFPEFVASSPTGLVPALLLPAREETQAPPHTNFLFHGCL